jgi:hypothetical protein
LQPGLLRVQNLFHLCDPLLVGRVDFVVRVRADVDKALKEFAENFHLRMTNQKIRLKAVMEARNGRTIWTGVYECSACGLIFRPDSNDKGKLLEEFEAHKRGHMPTGSDR